MASSKYRTSFWLDDDTVAGLKRLASRWGESQAEVVRRAIALADESAAEETGNVIRNLRRYHRLNRVTPERADSYLDEVAGNRAGWR
ncbi:MAG: ribbon-helix-helix protein, CopG family [Spirochaetaceae bacterium]|nr:MAG: ribbon-helix-helix protein, CopG family [Spirochaetaceae bacterium]